MIIGMVLAMNAWAGDFQSVRLEGSTVVVGAWQEGAGQGMAVFFPPAHGGDGLLQEADDLAQAGVSVLVLRPPYVREEYATYPRGPEHPEGEFAFWELNAREICAVIESRRAVQAVVALGQNMGGSMAAFVAGRCPLAALISFGSVPRLSLFWQHSQADPAPAFRAGREALIPRFAALTAPLDLVATEKDLSIPVYLQYGEQDPWMDEEQRTLASSAFGLELEWFPDGHDMASARAREARRERVLRWLSPSLRHEFSD